MATTIKYQPTAADSFGSSSLYHVVVHTDESRDPYKAQVFIPNLSWQKALMVSNALNAQLDPPGPVYTTVW